MYLCMYIREKGPQSVSFIERLFVQNTSMCNMAMEKIEKKTCKQHRSEIPTCDLECMKQPPYNPSQPTALYCTHIRAKTLSSILRITHAFTCVIQSSTMAFVVSIIRSSTVFKICRSERSGGHSHHHSTLHHMTVTFIYCVRNIEAGLELVTFSA